MPKTKKPKTTCTSTISETEKKTWNHLHHKRQCWQLTMKKNKDVETT